MKSFLPWLLSAIFAGAFVTRDCMTSKPVEKPMDYIYEFKELETRRASNNQPWLQFLNVDSMYCGVYCLKVGEKDGQQPHQHDEVYVVKEGKGKIAIGEQDHDLSPGTIVFVPAQAQHHFHSITEDLKTIVFFSKLKPTDDKQNPE